MSKRRLKKIEVFPRTDGLMAWRVTAPNGNIIATDGGQGYARRGTAIKVLVGLFRLGDAQVSLLKATKPASVCYF